MTTAFVDYYALLGVANTASNDEIVIAFRRAALQHHPDKHSHENFAKANANFLPYIEAKDILSDRDSRNSYDLRYLRPIREQELKTAPAPTDCDGDSEWDENYFTQFDVPLEYRDSENLPFNWRFNPQPPSRYGSAAYVPKVAQGKCRAASMRKQNREAGASGKRPQKMKKRQATRRNEGMGMGKDCDWDMT